MFNSAEHLQFSITNFTFRYRQIRLLVPIYSILW